MPLLEADTLARRKPHSDGWLLDHVRLAVPAGQVVAVAGPSGSGKTVLLRALALLDPVDSGEVRLEGQAARRHDVPAFRRRVAYLHQRPVLVGQSVEEALAWPFALAIYGDRRFDPGRAGAMLAALGRDDGFLDKNTADLSGGEAQLVALVRSVSLDPTVLLLDEPTAALDPATTQSVEAWLQRWVVESPDPRAIVWVTHDAAQTQRLGVAPLGMKAGRLASEDDA